MRNTGLLRTVLAPSLALALSSTANATAISDIIVSAVLTIDSITSDAGDLGNLSIEGDALVIDVDNFANGNATADADGVALPAGPVPLVEDDVIDLAALASGESDPAGLTDAFFFTDGSLQLDNFSTFATFTISLIFDYDLAVSATVDNPAEEFAFSLGAVSLESVILTGNFLVDELAIVDTDFNPSDDPVLISDTLAFDIVLAPNTSEELLLLADAESQTAAVSAPASAALFALGLAGMGWRRLRRR